MTKHIAKIGFYRERDRARFQTGPGERLDPKTGEVIAIPSRTKQEFRDECDINNILAQYRQTGMVKHISARAAQGAYMDLPEPQDFQTATNIVLEARDSFMTLPSKVRERFGNDPLNFLWFMSDPDNQDEAIKLGLATRKPEPEPLASGGGAGGKKPPAGEVTSAPNEEPKGSKNAQAG